MQHSENGNSPYTLGWAFGELIEEDQDPLNPYAEDTPEHYSWEQGFEDGYAFNHIAVLRYAGIEKRIAKWSN